MGGGNGSSIYSPKATIVHGVADTEKKSRPHSLAKIKKGPKGECELRWPMLEAGVLGGDIGASSTEKRQVQVRAVHSVMFPSRHVSSRVECLYH